MNKYFVNKRLMLFTAVLSGAVSMSGCGNTSDKEQELASFSAAIADFTDYMQEADVQINSLDTSKKESADELLEILDQMEAEFAAFSTIQAPEQYESVPHLAARASEAMSLAVSYYHTAYESEVFDQDYADAAYECYADSMKVVGYIGMLLLGEKIPEDANVTVYEITNDEHILDNWLSGGKEDDTDNHNAGESETTSE